MFKPQPMGLALGLTLAALYTVCSVAFALAPNATAGFFAAWFHGFQISPSANPLTFGHFIYGLVGIAVSGYVAGLLFAWLYTRIAGDAAHSGRQRSAPG